MFASISFQKILTFIALVSVFPVSAFADGHEYGHREHWHGHGRWNSGYWHHGYHERRLGWWWVVNGTWYFYPRPVVQVPEPYEPPQVTVMQMPPVVVPPSGVYIQIGIK